MITAKMPFSKPNGAKYVHFQVIAANLAKGFDLDASVKRAKDYISGALAAMLDLGKGSGPMNNAFDIQSKFTKENSEAEQ